MGDLLRNTNRDGLGLFRVSMCGGTQEIEPMSTEGSHYSLSTGILPSLGARSNRRVKLRRFIVSPYDRRYRFFFWLFLYIYWYMCVYLHVLADSLLSLFGSLGFEISWFGWTGPTEVFLQSNIIPVNYTFVTCFTPWKHIFLTNSRKRTFLRWSSLTFLVLVVFLVFLDYVDGEKWNGYCFF